MRIKKIGIDNYGKFEAENNTVELKSGLNVILGENEAGKSTLRYALGELLYGFQSKKIDRHPYSTGDSIKLSGELEYTGGETVGIQRLLKNASEGQLIIGNHVSEIGNTVVENLKEIPYALYKGLFELDLSALVALDTQKWKQVEAQISLQYGLENILTPQHVLSQLENEMHLIWRPHNRGRYIVKEIDETLLSLKDKKRTLNKQKQSLEDRVSRKAKVEAEIQEMTQGIENASEWIKKAEHQLDAYKALSEIRKIEMELSAFDFESMRVETYNFLMLENEKLREEKVEIEQALKAIQSQRKSYSGLQEQLLISEERKEEILRRLEAHKANAFSYDEDKTRVKQKKTVIEGKSLELTSDPWNDALMNYWSQLDLNGLEKTVKSRLRFSFGNIGLWIVLLLGISGIVGGVYLDKMELAYGGSALSLLGFLPMFGSFNRKPLEFGDIQFRDLVWKKKDIFIDACEKIADMAEELSACVNTFETTRQTYLGSKAKVEDLINELGLDNEYSLEENIKLILSGVENASQKEQTNKLLDANASIHNARKRKIGHALLMNQQKLTTFKNDLKKYGASPEEGLAMLERLAALKHRRDSLVEELDVYDKENPDMHAYRESLEFENSIKEEKQRFEGLKLDRENLKIEHMSLQKDEERIFEDVRLETIESEISKLEWERRSSIEKYNKLRMIHTMIKFADETFRSKYQPELLKRASALLELFTDGKYNQLAANESGGLQIKDTKRDRYIPVQDKLSRGTLEQIYLALRIAVAETIDQTENAIPILLDEVFVNWDKKRLEGALEVLTELSSKRQIVYFTCHEWMADRLVTVGAHKVML